MKPEKVGLKYCGGCNPDYDRTALAASIRERLKDRVEFVSHYNGGYDKVLIITGCECACVDVKPFADKEVHIVTRESQAEYFIRRFME